MTDEMHEAWLRDQQTDRDCRAAEDALTKLLPAFHELRAKAHLENALTALRDRRARIVRTWD